VDFSEPMLALYNQGMVLGEDGEKMSKSRGNVIAPDELVRKHGADTVRTYLMFFAKWDQGGPWNYAGIKGPQRLLFDVWEIANFDYQSTTVVESATRDLRRKTHQAIRKVSENMRTFSFNTTVAAIMELRNAILTVKRELNADPEAWIEAVDSLLLLLAPIAPHITEELWHRKANGTSIHLEPWPEWNAEIAKEEMVTLVVQINGKVRDRTEVTADLDDESLKATALSSMKIQSWLEGKTPRKIIVVQGKLVNIVI
jgi:leucyl-tRNA synthetase